MYNVYDEKITTKGNLLRYPTFYQNEMYTFNPL